MAEHAHGEPKVSRASNRPHASLSPSNSASAEVSDDTLAHILQQAGMVSFDQLEAARQQQSAQVKQGNGLSLADVLILQEVLTPAILENVAKKARGHTAGGIQSLGHYKLLKSIGEGGMGKVFLAEDTHVGRMVAVKVLPKKLAGNRQFLARFHREAIATGKLNHINIVAAHTVGEEHGIHYYAMEYCDGEPLNVILKKVPFVPCDMATGVILQAARGLKHAHDHGIVHRDIKPANILICRPSGKAGAMLTPASSSPLDILADDFVVKILDLGLSKDTSLEAGSFCTQTSVALGTPHYIAPEQAKGLKGIDGRSDIYSLGATYYHMVTGKTPFSGATGPEIMLKHLTEQLPNPQDVNDEVTDAVSHIIQKMMGKAQEDRYQDCQELLEDLELVIKDLNPSSQAIDVARSNVATARRRSTGGPPARGNLDRRGGRDGRGPSPLRRGTRGHEPVGLERCADGKSRSARSSQKTFFLILGGVVLLLSGFMIAGRGDNGETARLAAAREKEAHEEEQRRRDEQARQEAEAERLKREEDERKKKAERAETARLAAEREEKAAEEARQKIEAERLEKERLKRENDARKEEAERKEAARLAAEREKKAAEEEQRRRDEQARQEAERLEKERLKREEDKRKEEAKPVVPVTYSSKQYGLSITAPKGEPAWKVNPNPEQPDPMNRVIVEFNPPEDQKSSVALAVQNLQMPVSPQHVAPQIERGMKAAYKAFQKVQSRFITSGEVKGFELEYLAILPDGSKGHVLFRSFIRGKQMFMVNGGTDLKTWAKYGDAIRESVESLSFTGK